MNIYLEENGSLKEFQEYLKSIQFNDKANERIQQHVKNALKRTRDVVFGEDWNKVRYTVYKSIIGGNINIVPRKKKVKGAKSSSSAKRDFSNYINSKGNHRGGNRMPISERTLQIRKIQTERPDVLHIWKEHGTIMRMSRVGNRGFIGATNWFSSRFGKYEAAFVRTLIEEFDKYLEKVKLEHHQQ